MNPFHRWAAKLSRSGLLLLLLIGGTGAVWLNTTCRSWAWAYDEAVTPEAERLEEADLEIRLQRAARADYARTHQHPLPDSLTDGLRDTLALFGEAHREAATAALAERRARLHRTAGLLHAGEITSWMILLLLAYIMWSRAAGPEGRDPRPHLVFGRRPGDPPPDVPD